LQGFVDLLAVGPAGELVIIDFKTDAPPLGEPAVTHPGYVAQVRAYRDLLESAAVTGDVATRCALLFTSDGGLRWCG
jgi:ATP-dependent helicase/nuclease subunit A